MEKKSLNEAIMEEAGIPNLKDTFEDSRTRIDMPHSLGSAYIESEKRRKEIEDRFKEKDKEVEEYKKMYASEESKTRIKPEVNKKMYLSESLFEDSNAEESLEGAKQKDIFEDELSRRIGGAVYDAYIREFKKATGIDVEDMVSDEDPFWNKLSKAVESLNKTLYDFYYKSQKKSENEPLTEAKVRPEDDVDFDEFDMFAFISNLFVKEMKPDLLPLKSIGGFDSQGKELTATEDSIILGTNKEEDFDKVKEICDEYDFGHRDTKVSNGKSKFYHEIDVPTYENGYPMDVAEYFEEVEIPLENVMPEKYIRKLKASRKNTASAFDKKKK